MDVHKILVATDFSPDSEAAIDAATELARRFGARIELVHAVPMDHYYTASSAIGTVALPPGFFDDVRRAAEKRVKEVAERMSDDGVEVNFRATPGAASEVIQREAEELGVDMIVMGTRGHSGLKHVLMGSVAERTVRHAPCPVLTVKAETDAAEAQARPVGLATAMSAAG